MSTPLEHYRAAAEPLTPERIDGAARRMDEIAAVAHRSHRLVLTLGLLPVAVELLLRVATGMPYFSGVIFALLYAQLALRAAPLRTRTREGLTAVHLDVACRRPDTPLSEPALAGVLPSINRSLARGAVYEHVLMPGAAAFAVVLLSFLHFSGAPSRFAFIPVVLLIMLGGGAGMVGSAHSRLVKRLVPDH